MFMDDVLKSVNMYIVYVKMCILLSTMPCKVFFRALKKIRIINSSIKNMYTVIRVEYLGERVYRVSRCRAVDI